MSAADSRPSSAIEISRISTLRTLPVTVIGKLVDELDVARHLEVGDPALAERRTIVLAQLARRRAAA